MAAKDTVTRNKTAIQETLATDRMFILNKVYEKKLITQREYNNLKSIHQENDEGHVIELVDKIINKGEDYCQSFLNLLQTDESIKATFPGLQLNDTSVLPLPVQASSPLSGDLLEDNRRKGEPYELKSQPVGLCLIINNENFMDNTPRNGTEKDAQSLAEVFGWLGFRVLMCKDQTKDQMEQTLTDFASLSGLTELQVPSIQEWSGSTFTAPQTVLNKHGDAFICCILSHGKKDAVLGIDKEPLNIKQITRTFKGTIQSALTGKPKVFLIQACRGREIQPGVLLTDLQTDDGGPLSIPVEADVLVAYATVEDCVSFRHATNGSWFIQSVCQQLKEHCPRGEDIGSILCYVNNDVSEKEACRLPGVAKQMPEVKHTLRKKLVLWPHDE
ncbi:caspase-3-like [Odontesthes bonariensis]|uniref:caspase-3-like n=1 Tax=Odontesthes bonariensis TaxID=219752 RepID=UPI003F586FF6